MATHDEECVKARCVECVILGWITVPRRVWLAAVGLVMNGLGARIVGKLRQMINEPEPKAKVGKFMDRSRFGKKPSPPLLELISDGPSLNYS